MTTGEGQIIRAMPPISGGGGAPGEGEANPYAAFGLNADGSAIEALPPASTPDLGALAAENAALKAKVGGLEERFAKLPSDFEGMGKKFELVDRLVKAIAGDGENPKQAEYKKAWGELMDIAKIASPAVFKQLSRWESDPDSVERLERGANALAGARLADLNNSAHTTVVNLAKAVWKGENASTLNEIVMPFERTMTDMINASPEIQRRFAAGDMTVVEEMFQRLVKPHLSNRLRNKQNMLSDRGGPKPPPRGGARPGSDGGDGERDPKARRELLRTPAGRAQFHKEAVGRFLDRGRGDSE